MSHSRWDRTICKALHRVVRPEDMEDRRRRRSSSKALLLPVMEVHHHLSSSSKQVEDLADMAINRHRNMAAPEHLRPFSSQVATLQFLATSPCRLKATHPHSHRTMRQHPLLSLACHRFLRNPKATVDPLRVEAMVHHLHNSNISRSTRQALHPCHRLLIQSNRLSYSKY